MTGKGVALVAVMGSKELSPTTIDEGNGYRGGKTCERVEELEVM